MILPGSKATIADLAALRQTGWDIDLNAHVRRGGHVLGICGGYQMLAPKYPTRTGSRGLPGSVMLVWAYWMSRQCFRATKMLLEILG